jgi:SAM-dependent methyltransferase
MTEQRLYRHEEEERYAFVRQLLAELVPAQAEIVELGAAPGDQSVGLARAGYRVTAVDLGEASDAWGTQAEGTMATVLADAGVGLLIWDLEQLPYPLADESFDAVLLTEVLEHLREYPLRTLEEARRILRPGGVLVVTTPNAAYIRNRVRLALGRSVYTPMVDWLYGLPHARHAREYTVGELELLVRQAGLEPVRVIGRHFYRTGGSRTLLDRAAKAVIGRVARTAPTLGPALVVVARR